MHLSEGQSRKLMRMRGAYVTEACDRCGAVLGSIRWTIRGEPGAWCSQKCRDGIERRARTCQGCNVSLLGKRKGAHFCSDVCRIRHRVLDRPNKPKTSIQNATLTDSISRLGYETPMSTNIALKSPAIAISGFGDGDSQLAPSVSERSRNGRGLHR